MAPLIVTLSPVLQVSVPHFKKQPQGVPDPLAAVPKRRPVQQIKAAMEAEAQQAWGQAPLPTGVCWCWSAHVGRWRFPSMPCSE